MKTQKRIRDYGFVIGEMKTGEKNGITDVEGVLVGHTTLNDGPIKTGVTAVIPHGGNSFQDKVLAASYIINGFGKTAGTLQIDELGTLETPILLTNTLSVGVVRDGLMDYMLKNNEDICIETGTVNAVVCECNDSYLNDARGKHIIKEHVFEAIENATQEFEEGCVGAGMGMSSYGLKGGIGTASRLVTIDDTTYTVGALVLSNMGEKRDLTIKGIPVGQIINHHENTGGQERDKGSIIMILATDLPMDYRQLRRLCRRAGVGLSRTGSHLGNGSGDIVIGFTTANRTSHYSDKGFVDMKMLHEDYIDDVFRGVIESVEEAILNSLICAETTEGRNGHMRCSLKKYMPLIENRKQG